MNTFTHTVREKDEEIDRVCWRYFKSLKQLKDIYKLNPGLAEKGEYLEVGKEIIMPRYSEERERSEEKAKKLVNIWE